MSSPAVDVAKGITLDFGTSNFAAELVDCELSGYIREFIETTHQGTGDWKTFKPKKTVDPGGVEAVFHYNPDTVPPMTQDPEVITITMPSGTTITATGFMTNFTPTGKLDDKMVATATVKLSGEPVVDSTP